MGQLQACCPGRGAGGPGVLFAVKNLPDTQHRRNCHKEHAFPSPWKSLPPSCLTRSVVECGQCRRTKTASYAGLSRICNIRGKFMLWTMCLTTWVPLEPS